MQWRGQPSAVQVTAKAALFLFCFRFHVSIAMSLNGSAVVSADTSQQDGPGLHSQMGYYLT